VTEGDSPYTGTGYFKFVLVNAAGDISYWSNDGTSTGGGEPTDGVQLTVEDGLFHVLLGDTNLMNMTALTASSFEGTERYLRVWFSSDGSTYTPLMPDQRIAAVPYALQAQDAVTAGDADTLDGQEGTYYSAWANLTGVPADIADGDDNTQLGEGEVETFVTNDPLDLAAGTTLDSSAISVEGHLHDDEYVNENQVDSLTSAMVTDGELTDADLQDGAALAEIKDDDGAGSGLDADTVDGQHADDFSLPVGALAASDSDNDTTLISEGYLFTGYRFSSDYWTTRSSMPTGRFGLASAVVDGVIYVLGGEGYSLSGAGTANEAYDPVTDSWTTKADMPTGRQFLAAASVDGIVYVVGGRNGLTANEAYDPSTNNWTQKAPIPTGRKRLSVAAVDGKLYAIGGESTSSNYENCNEAYDPVSDTWTTKADMPTGRRNLAAAAVNGVIYVMGGETHTNGWETVNEAYDPSIDTWISKAPMLKGRRGLDTAVVDNMIYAVGGSSITKNFDRGNHAYDPVTDTWTVKTRMLAGRTVHTAAAVNGTMYVIGGYSSSNTYESANEAYHAVAYVYIKK
jgi:N-acetylneuraminic acid mutarotase